MGLITQLKNNHHAVKAIEKYNAMTTNIININI
jgi:hypothetical protein